MATSWQTFPIELKGGLRSDLGVLPQGLEQPGSATFLQNFEPAKEGGYRRIKGYRKFSDTVVTGTGAILGVFVVDSTKVIASRLDGAGNVKYHSSVGSTWTEEGSVANEPDYSRFVEFKFGTNRKVFIVDGVSHPSVYDIDGDSFSTLTTESDLEGASNAIVFRQHMFVAVDNLLYFSEPYDETAWTPGGGAGSINMGQDITGMAVFRNELFVFSATSIQKISGSSVSDFTLSPVAERMGCIAGDTIQEVGGDIAFLAQDGVRLLSATDRLNDFSLDVLSDRIPRSFQTFTDTTSPHFKSVVVRGKAQYRLFSYQSAAPEENSKGLLFTKFSDQGASDIAWGTLTGFKVYCSDSRYTSAGEKIVFGNTTGYVYSMESGNSFDGEDIEAIYRSPNIPIEDPKVRKTLYRAALFTDAEGAISLTLNLGYDMPRATNYNEVVAPTISLSYTQGEVFYYGNPASVYGTAVYGAPIDSVFESPLIGSGKTFYFRISDKSKNPPFSIDTIVFDYEPQDRQ